MCVLTFAAVSWKCRGQLVWFSRDVRKQWVKHIRLSLAALLTGYHDLCNVFCVDVEWTESACMHAATACGNLPEEHSGAACKNDSNAKLGPRSLACSFSSLVLWLLSDALESQIRDTGYFAKLAIKNKKKLLCMNIKDVILLPPLETQQICICTHMHTPKLHSFEFHPHYLITYIL